MPSSVLFRCVLAALLAAVLASPAAAQAPTVTQADIQRLQDNVFQAGADVTQLRSRDAARADRLQTELDELREEVIYLKVKLRKERSLARAEYADVRDRIEDLRTRARGDAVAAAAPAPRPPVTPAPATRGTAESRATLEIPVGTEIDVRLSNTLNSGTAQVEDRFEATTLVDLSIDGRTAVPAGSVVRGVVTSVDPATRTNRTARMTVSFDQITVNGRASPLRATVTQAIQGEGIRGETGRIGTGAGVGAIIGGILGGFKGALAGILIGAGGTLAATEGNEVELPQGSVLRIRIDAPVQIAR
ncbi:MAG: hypothetical protein HY657_15385 [Acidobacteria bacterium]|nr:hypothetical protein [Acidobacteriota bacterium]